MIALSPSLSRQAADYVQRLTYPQRAAFYGGIAVARTETDVRALLNDGAPAAAAPWREEQHHRGWHGRFGHGTNPGTGEGSPAVPGAPPAADISGDAAAVTRFTAKAAAAVPHLLGGGQNMWNGQVDTFTATEHPAWAGVTDWDGKISLLDSIAAEAAATLADPGRPVTNPDAFDVILHELMHCVMGGRTEQADKEWAKLTDADAAILDSFGRLDQASPAGGAYPIVHTLDELHRDDPAITQPEIDSLVKRGLLVKADFANIVYSTDGEPVRHELWKLSGTARQIIPGPPPDRKDDARAYNASKAAAGIEEGFTELGAAQHAEGFFTAMGIGGRQTAVLAEAHGHTIDNPEFARKRAPILAEIGGVIDRLRAGPTSLWNTANVLDEARYNLQNYDLTGALERVKALQHTGVSADYDQAMKLQAGIRDLIGTAQLQHATLAEYARRLADPKRIKAGEAWGHYPDLTAGALAWSQALVIPYAHGKKATAAELRQQAIALADEVNREGADGKIVAMSRQVVTFWGADPDTPGVPWGKIQAAIEAHWPDGASSAYYAGNVVEGWLNSKSRAAAPKAGSPAGPRTAAGRKADELATWAWADPAARAAEAVTRIEDLARQSAGDAAALREVQDTGRMLARLADAVTGE